MPRWGCLCKLAVRSDVAFAACPPLTHAQSPAVTPFHAAFTQAEEAVLDNAAAEETPVDAVQDDAGTTVAQVQTAIADVRLAAAMRA